MRAGEKRKITVVMDYEGRAMSRDLSVVVWGFDGKVKLEHNDGIPSESFPKLRV